MLSLFLEFLKGVYMDKKTNTEKRSAAIIAIALAWTFYLFSYAARVEPSVLVNELMSDFSITSSVVGSVISVAYIPYVILQIPCGIITDKLGVRIMITASCLTSALGIYIFGAAESVFQLQMGRFLIGIASASSFLCCGKIAGDFFDKKKYAMLMGIAMFMGCIGASAGTSPIAYLVSHAGWRQATFMIAAIGVVLAIFSFIFIRDKKNEKNNKDTHENKLLHGLKIMAKNPSVWILGFYGAIAYLPLSAIAELWGVPFMELRYGVSTEKASISSIFIFIGFGLGGLVSAYIAEKINSYKKTIIVFTFGLIFALSAAIYSDAISFPICLSLLFLGGVFAGANTLCFAIVFHLVPKEYTGTSAGFINALIMTSGIVFQPLLGKLLDFFRNGIVNSSGEPFYNVGMYRSAFVVLVFGLVLAAISTFFIHDIKHEDEEKSKGV